MFFKISTHSHTPRPASPRSPTAQPVPAQKLPVKRGELCRSRRGLSGTRCPSASPVIWSCAGTATSVSGLSSWRRLLLAPWTSKSWVKRLPSSGTHCRSFARASPVILHGIMGRQGRVGRPACFRRTRAKDHAAKAAAAAETARQSAAAAKQAALETVRALEASEASEADLGEGLRGCGAVLARGGHRDSPHTAQPGEERQSGRGSRQESAHRGNRGMVHESGIKDALPGSFLSTLRAFSVAQVVDLNLLFDSADRVDISAALPPLVQAAVASHHKAVDLVTFVLLPASPDLSLPLQVPIGKACLEKGLTMRQMTVSLKSACSRLTLTVIGRV